jgi:ATP-dependent DNA helicase RecQ
VLENEKISTTSTSEIKDLFDKKKPQYICGHNFIDHDKKFLAKTSFNPVFEHTTIIDTLFLSMILFTNKKTHKLDKPYKTEVNIENQPLGDAEQTKELFLYLDSKFNDLDDNLKQIFINLLFENTYYKGYFESKNFTTKRIDIYEYLKDKIKCSKKELTAIQSDYPTELAFIISYLSFDSEASISSVILIRYPKVPELLKQLVFKEKDIKLEEFAEQEFGISSFREFEKESNDLFDFGNISQKDIVQSSLGNVSLLTILPTGGGKTFTFQLPALIKAKAYKGLTVVISPLQALMKNHVDSFKDKNQNFRVVAISGYLSPIERMSIINEVENGVVDILYLAPEALRSNSVYKALRKRIIERFVIDEAHCFSSWGHDFRHDYYFVAPTIKELEKSSPFQSKIPVSCFTATAKPEVLNDIKNYFSSNLDIELKEFIASSKRYNLEYKAIEVSTKKEKYHLLVGELINQGKTPTIIYIPQNARECRELSEKLRKEERLMELNLEIEPFYSKIDIEIENGKRVGRNKGEILNDFIDNKIDIVIATTAFGMGIDKPDIQTVIHYEQSDSLESYLQESGRGARDVNLKARCIVLYSKEDFNRTFAQLNNSKLDYHEIDRIVKILKKDKRDEIYISPKQLAKQMGIDTEDSKIDYETMIKTALLELEQAGIIARGRNGYKIFATSVEEKNSMEYVHDILDGEQDNLQKNYEYEIYQYMVMVMQNIIQRSKKDAIEVDDLADIVGVEKRKIFDVLYELQKLKLLEFNNDISVFVQKSIEKDIEKYFSIEQLILQEFKNIPTFESSINLRDLNSKIDDKNGLSTIKKIIQSWSHLSKLKANIFNASFQKYMCNFEIEKKNIPLLEHMIKRRKETCQFIVKRLLEELENNNKEQDEIEISTNKLKIDFDGDKQKISLEGFHHSLVYLHELVKNSFNLRKGRLIYYQTYKITKKENLELNTPYRKRDHYNKSLKPYYERKIESIHIQIAFLEKLIKDGWSKTSSFVQDYFGMEYTKFKKKYKFDDKHIKLPVTQERLKEIIYDLNNEQKAIFEDNKSDSIMVLAGPGSGKTKILVHKIASLVTIENNKPEYFLMLAHSRTAVAEFRDRLYKLIGNQIYDMKIFTFHSFAVNLLAKKIDNENISLHNIIEQATSLLERDEIELPYIQMLILDEYQDVGAKTYKFIKALYSKMAKDKKIIAVGDDDQCINNFGEDKADINFINKFQKDFEEVDDEEKDFTFSQYSLLTNYRSKNNIVEFSNQYRTLIPNSLKTETLIPFTKENGQIDITYYKDNTYVKNVVYTVIDDDSDNIVILLRNNDEVLTFYSELLANNVNAKYITSKDGFKLGNLIELQDFLAVWKNKSLDDAYKYIEYNYKDSKNYNLANKVIEKFVQEYEEEMQNNSHNFSSVFEEYLKEIEFEEFEYTKADVVVSTMHKSKGKEFDNVYLCINDKFVQNDYDIRLLYVALTRARKSLQIHTKDRLFNFLNPYANGVQDYTILDKEPNRIVFVMGLGDIALSNQYSAKGIENTKPIAGERCQILQGRFGGFEIRKNNQQIAKLASPSQEKERLSNKILMKLQQGYILEDEVEIDYVVNWISNEEKVFTQVLCKVYMSVS